MVMRDRTRPVLAGGSSADEPYLLLGFPVFTPVNSLHVFLLLRLKKKKSCEKFSLFNL